MAVTQLTAPHWSQEIPLHTDHYRMAALAETGFVALRDLDPPVPDEEFLSLEYMDWKSGGDTNFAPIATADGELDCRGFWKPGEERADKNGILTANAKLCPTIAAYVRDSGVNFGRVRVIKLEHQHYDEALRHMHRDDNNRFNPDGDGWVVRSWIELTDNPDSFMCLMESATTACPTPRPRSESRCTAAHGSSSTRSGCGTWWCTTAPSRATRSSRASRAVPRSKPGSNAKGELDCSELRASDAS